VFRGLPYNTVRGFELPVEGYKTVTINELVFVDLEEYAKSTCRSIPQAIEFLLSEAKKRLEATH